MKKSFKMLLLKPLNHLKTNYAGMFLGWLNYLSFPRIRCSPTSIHVDSLQLNTCFYLCSLLDYQPVEQVNINVINGSPISKYFRPSYSHVTCLIF